MRTCALLLSLLGLAACEPAPGEVYEHRETGVRIRIVAVGEGAHLHEYYQGLRDEAQRVGLDRQGLPGVAPVVHYAEGDSLARCFAYEKLGREARPLVCIRRIEALRQEYDRVY